MSQDAHLIDSLLTVLAWMQSGEVLSTQELADAAGMEKAEMTELIHTLAHAGFNVIYDEKKQGFWLPGSYLPPTELTLDEILALLKLTGSKKISASNGSSRRKLNPLNDALRSAMVKLFNRLPADLQQYVGDMHEREELLPPPRQGGLDRTTAFVNTLQQAIVEQRKVTARYDSPTEDGQIRTILHPYRLVFMKRAWYLAAYSTRHRMARTFQVSRILDLKIKNTRFTVPDRFSITNHFGNAWQVERDKEHRAQVRVRFSPEVARDVSEVTWHRTQETSFNPDGSLDFKVSVDGLNEIANWLFGFGTHAEVLEPAELRQILADQSRQLLSVYEED
jgi:proteasome accessory factor B